MTTTTETAGAGARVAAATKGIDHAAPLMSAIAGDRKVHESEWGFFCFVFLGLLMHIYFSIVFKCGSLNKISSDLVGGCMEEEEAGAVKTTGTL